jgi:hypothetical protein
MPTSAFTLEETNLKIETEISQIREGLGKFSSKLDEIINLLVQFVEDSKSEAEKLEQL